MAWDGYQWQRPGQITLPGSVQTLSYDALQRAKGINVKANTATVLNRAYTYDKAGNLIERQTEEGTYSYGYDLLDRITQVNPPQSVQDSLPVEAFAYDAVHNRIGSAQQPGDWQYNANNQLMQFGEGTNQTVYTYTANGHVATEATPAAQGGKIKTYTYDATDRLVSVHSGNDEVARYAYDPFGRRISKTVNGVTTHYIYTDEGLIAELDSTGNIQVAYGWQADAMYGTSPLWQAQVNNNNLQTAGYHFIITDHLGTPQMAVDPSGETTWKATAEVFGKTTPNAANQITMNLRFPGQYFDAETGAHYNYFWDYNPAIGRYVQSDPIGLSGGINLYSYTRNRVLDLTDPFGLQDFEAYDKAVQESSVSANDLRGGQGLSRADWNSPQLIRRNSCYSYAINRPFLWMHPQTSELANPGEAAWGDEGFMPDYDVIINDEGKEEIGERLSCGKLVGGAKDDGYVEDTDENGECPEGYRKIQTFISPKTKEYGLDFHFYRQEADGNWTHKRGQLEVTDLDGSGQIITDPGTANRYYDNGEQGKENYSEGCGVSCAKI